MAIYAFEKRIPEVDESAYVSSSSEIIGDVTIGKECFIGPGARIKGDYGSIIIGDYSNVQENCVIHARPGEKTVIGNYVSIGHAAVIHGAHIEDHATVGMGAIVSDFAKVGKWSVVGEGAVVVSRTEVSDEGIAVGTPAKVIGSVDDDFKEMWTEYKELYRSLSQRYKEGLRKVG
ncbi:MAG: gamma carbonic anhydrase family protein [Thermoplasmata archaeon]